MGKERLCQLAGVLEAARSVWDPPRKFVGAFLSQMVVSKRASRRTNTTQCCSLLGCIYTFSKHHMFSQASALAKHHIPLSRQLPENHHISVLSKTSSTCLLQQKHPLIRQFPEKHHMTQLSLRRNQTFPLQLFESDTLEAYLKVCQVPADELTRDAINHHLCFLGFGGAPETLSAP